MMDGYGEIPLPSMEDHFYLNHITFGLMLNCNWFQPFHHTQYSIGVIYLVILNLPRTIRFKPENIIIVGIISGPSEPTANLILGP